MNFTTKILSFIVAFASILNTRVKCDAEVEPSIDSIESGYFLEDIIGGMPSGGNPIRIHGSFFNAIQEANIRVTYNSENYTESCEIESRYLVVCKFPAIPIDDDIDANNPISLDSSVEFDDKYYDYHALIYPDPTYYKFPEPDHVKSFLSDYLTLEGKNLDRVTKESDITVQIGKSFCNVTSISSSQLTCRTPQTQPAALNSDNHLPEVVVLVANLRFEIGYLSYLLREPEFA